VERRRYTENKQLTSDKDTGTAEFHGDAILKLDKKKILHERTSTEAVGILLAYFKTGAMYTLSQPPWKN
jgi:hypothetical protein